LATTSMKATEILSVSEAEQLGATRRQTYKVLMAPIRIVSTYLFITYLLFVIGPLWDEVENKLDLSVLVIFCYTALFCGFYLSTMNQLSFARRIEIPEINFNALGRFLFAAGSFYFLVWSVNQVVGFGMSSPAEVLSRILNPGDAYASKFEIYEMRESTQRISRATQFLVLFSVIFAFYIPITVLAWGKLSKKKKVIFNVCILLYAISFLAIGTLKGLGDIIIIFFASFIIVLGRRSLKRQPILFKILERRKNKKFIAIIAIMFIAFSSYMITNQTNRAIIFGIQNSRLVGDIDQSMLTNIVGPEWAMGIAITMAYPTHGYAGLSFAMTEPFEFAGGAGVAPAFESYRYQYFGGARRDLLTYPARAEHNSGWPNGMYWSTAIAEIASDISFFGVPILFFVIGYAFSRTWFSCLFSNSYVAYAALPLFFTFCFFVPANNQVLLPRQGLITAVCLLFIAAIKPILPKKTQ
jgi:hypothetical protein